jgi:WD40 repeat protein/serine/threonine protein kinase
MANPGPSENDDQLDSTVPSIADTGARPSDDHKSIMASSEIGVTINPRELSDQDVTAWNSAVGDHHQTTELKATVVRQSYAEQQLGKLRRVDLAALQSETDQSFDYRLVRKLGQGGMGDVFVARQGSLDRLLALKLIKPLSGRKRDQLEKTGRLNAVEEERRQQFLSEAIVTGDLDHPNIVPIHDVGLTSDNRLFYAMKRVIGTPWSDVIKEKSQDENLEILLKAADAIGFAHTRGVVHRDIKPENIMLGDFGVVMVMDWGLALLTSDYEKQESITATSGLGGTPAFMSPEMATGPIEQIGTAADIYLLGATLFMIITGKPPHFGNNITECLQAVRANVIREVPPGLQGELLDVALKAMATKPPDRYRNVPEFQTAIRQYRSHAESISLAARAAEDLELGKQNRNYADLSRASFRFEEALKSWPHNDKAIHGLAETKRLHAAAALQNGDYDLGLSLLDPESIEQRPLVEQLRAAIQERNSRASRLSLLRKVAAVMLAVILVGGSIALYTINREKRIAEQEKRFAIEAKEQEAQARSSAEVARVQAEQARAQAESAREAEQDARREAEEQQLLAEISAEDAKRQEQIAIREKSAADEQRQQAVAAKTEAEQARDEAEQARRRATYEEYVSKIGLATARLQRHEVDGARDTLRELQQINPQVVDNWEWRWLWRQAHQANSSAALATPIIDMSMVSSGREGVLALASGRVERFMIDSAGSITGTNPIVIPAVTSQQSTAVAIDSSSGKIAIGTNSGQIVLVAGSDWTTLNAHAARINDLQFLGPELLISGSQDRTVRLWDPAAGRELTKSKAIWHLSPVVQLAAAGSKSSLTLATATADQKTGRIEVYHLQVRNNAIDAKHTGSFDGHHEPVTSVAVSDDEQQFASGDKSGVLLLWNAADLKSANYTDSLQVAIAEDSSVGQPTRPSSQEVMEEKSLVDPALTDFQLVSTGPAETDARKAHQDRIRSIRFATGGTDLLTGSDDYTVKIWDSRKRRLTKTLTGHGGWVVAAEFLADRNDTIVSASNDATVRSWKPTSFLGSFVTANVTPAVDAGLQAAVHQDEIVSVSLSPDGRQLVTASRDHTARVMRIDPATLAFKEVARMQHQALQDGSDFVALSFQLDVAHQRLYVGSADATIRVWDLKRAVMLGQATGTGLNTAFVISADGNWMLTGSSSPAAKAILWRLDPTGTASPRVVHRLQGHALAVSAFAISADAKHLFTGDRGGRGWLWNAESGQPIGEPIDTLRGYRINAAHFLPAGNELLIAADDENLTRFDLRSRSVRERLHHPGVVTGLAVSNDGQLALTVSELTMESDTETAASLWRLSSATEIKLDQAMDLDRSTGERITSAQFDSTSENVLVTRAATATAPATLKWWSVDQVVAETAISPPPVTRTQRLPVMLGTAQVAVPIADGSLLTMNKNGVFRWRVDDGELINSYRPHAALTEASFSFDGKRIATASRSVKLWDVQTAAVIAKLESPHIGPVRTVQFAPRAVGRWQSIFATGGDDGYVRVWSWDERTMKTEMLVEQPFDSAVQRLRFSPDAKQLLVVGQQGLARLWQWSQPNHQMVFDVPDAVDFTSAAFSPDGTAIVIGGTDYLARLWLLPAAGEQPDPPIVFSGHADVVHDVKLLGKSIANMRVLTASADDTVRLWDPRLATGGELAGRELLSLRQHTADVMSVDVTHDEALAITADRSGTVILWPASLGDRKIGGL